MASIYIHIPFCEKKCLYCDFYSIENRSHTDDFLKALEKEIQVCSGIGDGEPISTIFFGGGTPSLLTPPELGRIIESLQSCFRVEPEAEITVETNPGTVTREKLREYRNVGVNRLSIGVQSFNDQELRYLGRIHNSAQARNCIRYAAEAGFENISLDLIYALPGQQVTMWKRTLTEAVAFHPDHISAYSLIVEPGTPLARMVSAKLISPTPTEQEADLYQYSMEFLGAEDFEQYEVSNYARSGFRSQHNYSYWSHANYLGLGPSAHSFWRDGNSWRTARRWSNVRNISTYILNLENGKPVLDSDEKLCEEELAFERIFLGLRSDGVDLARLRNDFGLDLLRTHNELLGRLKENRLVLINNDLVRLTPHGYLICDEICGQLMS